MRKGKYNNTANAFNIAIAGQVGHVPVKKNAGISITDDYISKRIEKNQESSDYGWINEIPSSIKREYGRMSNTQKALFWLTGFALVGVAGYASSDTVRKTVDSNAKKVYDKIFSQSNSKAIGGAPAIVPVIDKAAVNETIKSATTPQHVFTPGLKVYGSEEYKKRVQDSLDVLNKTPDSFRIDGMTAYQYATYYLDELHEGPEEKYIDVGIEQYPIKYISASNLIHIPRHIEQGHNKTLEKQLKQWNKKYPNDDPSLIYEYDAIELQASWGKARYNLTDEQRKDSFVASMRQYTNDSKYFEDALIKN